MSEVRSKLSKVERRTDHDPQPCVNVGIYISLVNTKEVIQCFQHDMHVGGTS
jgi:hypothetical protein